MEQFFLLFFFFQLSIKIKIMTLKMSVPVLNHTRKMIQCCRTEIENKPSLQQDCTSEIYDRFSWSSQVGAFWLVILGRWYSHLLCLFQDDLRWWALSLSIECRSKVLVAQICSELHLGCITLVGNPIGVKVKWLLQCRLRFRPCLHLVLTLPRPDMQTNRYRISTCRDWMWFLFFFTHERQQHTKLLLVVKNNTLPVCWIFFFVCLFNRWTVHTVDNKNGYEKIFKKNKKHGRWQTERG